MIKFTNNYMSEEGHINTEDLISDIIACKILLKAYKGIGDKMNEYLIRKEFMKRKAFAEVHNIQTVSI